MCPATRCAPTLLSLFSHSWLIPLLRIHALDILKHSKRYIPALLVMTATCSLLGDFVFLASCTRWFDSVIPKRLSYFLHFCSWFSKSQMFFSTLPCKWWIKTKSVIIITDTQLKTIWSYVFFKISTYLGGGHYDDIFPRIFFFWSTFSQNLKVTLEILSLNSLVVFIGRCCSRDFQP